jgi:hypothetical protein
MINDSQLKVFVVKVGSKTYGSLRANRGVMHHIPGFDGNIVVFEPEKHDR